MSDVLWYVNALITKGIYTSLYRGIVCILIQREYNYPDTEGCQQCYKEGVRICIQRLISASLFTGKLALL